LAFAPKPYLVLSAVRDFFSIAGARATFAEAQRVYEKLGQSERIAMSEVDKGHGYHQKNRLAAYRWFSRWLDHEDNDTAEPEIELAEFHELACTDTGQVATSLGGETVYSLNRARIESFDRKLPEEPAARREEVVERARALSGFDYEPGPVEVQR